MRLLGDERQPYTNGSKPSPSEGPQPMCKAEQELYTGNASDS